MYLNSQVIPITDSDIILGKQPRIRKALWIDGDQGYLMVYASWCPNCINKVDMWKTLAQTTHKKYDNKRFLIMAADIEKEVPKLADAMMIRSIPTLLRVNPQGYLEKVESVQWSPVELSKNI